MEHKKSDWKRRIQKYPNPIKDEEQNAVRSVRLWHQSRTAMQLTKHHKARQGLIIGVYGLISVKDWGISIKIGGRKQHDSPDHSGTFGRRWKSEQQLRTPLNHCAVCSGMPMFTERSLMKNLWLLDERARTLLMLWCLVCNSKFASSNEGPKINSKSSRIPC